MDVTSKEKEVMERLDKEREVTKEKLSMSRTNSRTASERSPLVGTRTPPSSAAVAGVSPKLAHAAAQPKPALAPSVRPTLSFASAAKREAEKKAEDAEKKKQAEGDDAVEAVTAKVAEVAV